MRAVLQRLSVATRPRNLLGIALVLGLLSSYANSGTSAERREGFFTAPSTFESGTVDVAGLLDPTKASTLPSATAFKWDNSGKGADCATLLPLEDITTQAMSPGHYCVAKITLRNTNTKSIDAWIRVRLVRKTDASNAQVNAMNDRLRFYMHEYKGGTARTAEQYQDADCNAASYKPVSSVPNTAASSAIIAPVSSTVMGDRLPLLSVGQAGKNVGTHPGESSPAYADVTALAGTGFGISAGTGLATPPSSNANVDSWNMSTNPANPATYNAFNLLGNDEVTNPRRRLESNTPNGTRPAGALLDAELLAGGTRYYCAALYFPSDTDLFASNTSGDNAAAGAPVLEYHLVVAAAQQFARSVD